MRRFHLALFILAALLAALQCRPLWAVDTPEFPSSPANWINAPVLSLEGVKGKAVFLWYFEEECPKCKAKWPGLMATAKKFEGQPILFLAVNSGTPRPAIEQYIKEVNLTWPVLLDVSRDYEKASGVGVISLQNIHQLRVIQPDGTMVSGNWEDIEGTINSALIGAHWKVDPKDIPPSLIKAWQAVEFSNYSAGATVINHSLLSPKPEIKGAAEKLKAATEAEMLKQIEIAKATAAKGTPWETYKAYARVTDRFQGFDIPDEFTEAKSELAKDETVRPQLNAEHSLEAAKKVAAGDRSPSHIRTTTALKKIIQDLPDTDAAVEAKTLLEHVGK